MKKFIYKFCVYKNNLRDGIQFVAAFDSLQLALSCKEHLQITRGGCCDVVKKRFSLNQKTPFKTSIYNNYKYHSYDL